MTFLQDAEISCLSVFPQLPSHILFGDGESKLSLLDLGQGSTLHLMPNTLVTSYSIHLPPLPTNFWSRFLSLL